MVSQLSTLNSQLLQQHFDTLAETPDAVAKLRHLVVELAAHGVFGGAGAKSVLLGTEAQFVMGQAPPGMECNESGDGTIFVKAGEFGALYPEICCWTTKPLRLSKKGDVLICVVGATVGKLNLAIDSAIGRSVAAIRPSERLDTRYLYYSLMPFTLRLRGASRGSAYGVIGKDELNAVKLLLPTVAEQRRIVAKVEELLALCDELEAAQTAAREHRTRLVRSALDHLTTAQTEPEFRQHAAFVLQHSDLVLDSADDLRQGILSLAAEGRLVEQNSKDEPASKLLVDIAAEKRRFLNEGNSGRSKIQQYDPVEISDSNHAPKGWVWTSLGHVSLRIHYGYTASADHASRDVRLLRITDIQDNRVDWDSVPGCAIDEADVPKHRLAAGDILIARTGGTIGKTFLVESDPPKAVFASYLIRVIPSKLISVRFLKLFLESPHYWKQLRAKSAGTGQPNVNGEALSGLALALPPLAEQQRIVAKVDELMRWCDALEARLTAAQTTAAHLLDATLHQILTA